MERGQGLWLSAQRPVACHAPGLGNSLSGTGGPPPYTRPSTSAAARCQAVISRPRGSSRWAQDCLRNASSSSRSTESVRPAAVSTKGAAPSESLRRNVSTCRRQSPGGWPGLLTACRRPCAQALGPVARHAGQPSRSSAPCRAVTPDGQPAESAARARRRRQAGQPRLGALRLAGDQQRRRRRRRTRQVRCFGHGPGNVPPRGCQLADGIPLPQARRLAGRADVAFLRSERGGGERGAQPGADVGVCVAVPASSARPGGPAASRERMSPASQAASLFPARGSAARRCGRQRPWGRGNGRGDPPPADRSAVSLAPDRSASASRAQARQGPAASSRRPGSGLPPGAGSVYKAVIRPAAPGWPSKPWYAPGRSRATRIAG